VVFDRAQGAKYVGTYLIQCPRLTGLWSTEYGTLKEENTLTCSLHIRENFYHTLRTNLSLTILQYHRAVNQGHCHPRIVATLVEQAQKLTLSSRAFYNSVFGRFAKHVTDMFGYDMVLPMNTGAEAVETSLKLSRKWAYEKKGVPEGKAIVLSVEGNFHGRTLGVIR
jgi:acetylornithine/succinyldiaminopimelate/putrescine aminotransferase